MRRRPASWVHLFRRPPSQPPKPHPPLLRRMYAFDVHCNSYFPLFLILYGGRSPPRPPTSSLAPPPRRRSPAPALPAPHSEPPADPRARSGAVLPLPAAPARVLLLHGALQLPLRHRDELLPLHAVPRVQRCDLRRRCATAPAAEARSELARAAGGGLTGFGFSPARPAPAVPQRSRSSTGRSFSCTRSRVRLDARDARARPADWLRALGARRGPPELALTRGETRKPRRHRHPAAHFHPRWVQPDPLCPGHLLLDLMRRGGARRQRSRGRCARVSRSASRSARRCREGSSMPDQRRGRSAEHCQRHRCRCRRESRARAL